MAFTLENEFVVTAPMERTWGVLLDLEQVAACLPGATIEPQEKEGVFRGSMRVKLGPMGMNYRGVARLEEVDEAGRVTVFSVQGNELHGQGTASAKVRSSLVEHDGGTRVRVETELSVTGRPAQLGRGIMQDVAASLFGDFAHCLSEMMAGEPAAEPEVAAVHAPVAPEALDLSPAVRHVLRTRLARWTGISALARLLTRLRKRS